MADNVREFPGRSGQGGARPPAPPQDWRQNLARRGSRILGDERNVLMAMRIAPELTGLVRWNEFAMKVEFALRPPWRPAQIGEKWTEQDDIALTEWLQHHDVEARQGVVPACVGVVARELRVHPVREYLERLKWDGEPRLQIAMMGYFGAEGPIDYLAFVGTKYLISAVARILAPGCQADHIIVLESPQGSGKSEAVRILGEPWTTDSLPDMHSKDSAIHLAGVWLVEIAELAGMRRSEIEPVKAFISRRVDRFRPPYGRYSVDVPRQCTFIGTTNEGTYLRDPTGNRRFWPVKCGEIDLAALARDRDQLWAEAVHQYTNSSVWHPVGREVELAAHEQEGRVLVTELEQQVADYLAKQHAAGLDETTTGDVFRFALNIDPGEDVERAGRLGAQLAYAMHRAGWDRVKVSGRGKDRRVIYRKAPIQGVMT